MSEMRMRQLPNGSMPANEGEFAWNDAETWCRMMLPGGHFTTIPTQRAEKARVQWQWNGSLDRPTLTPSVRVFCQFEGKPQEELWHGFITDGVMRSV